MREEKEETQEENDKIREKDNKGRSTVVSGENGKFLKSSGPVF